MLGVLEDIWHGILDIPYLVIGLLVTTLNGVFIALGAMLGVALGVLPSFPEPPSAPGGVIGGLLWFVPLGSMLSFFSLMLAAWVTFLGVKVALKWGKAL